MVDVLIIGAGFGGAVAGRILAEKGKKVEIIEKRDHIGGNCYDCFDDHGVLIHKYGPHIFHTKIKEVYDFLSRFTEWYPYKHEVLANVYGTYLPVPFNLNTLHKVFQEDADEIEELLVSTYGKESRVPILKLRESSNPKLQKVADYIYENVFLNYTMKQWGKKPEEIDPSVTGRVPVLVSYDNGYFQDDYQGMPKDGFTPLFEKMLKHENIKLTLSTDAKNVLKLENGKIYRDGKEFNGLVIFTGAVDEFFDCKYGRLPYRTLHFVSKYFKEDSYQPVAVVNYTVDQDYTRITEYKKLTGQKVKGTSIMEEYPASYTDPLKETPYYSIANDENLALYEKYQKEASSYKNFYLLGRLAEYKYYNIDGITKKAMELAEALS